MDWLMVFIHISFSALIVLLLLWFRLFSLQSQLRRAQIIRDEQIRLNALLGSYIDGRHGFYYLHDLAGKLVAISTGVRKTLGLNPEIISGRNIQSLMAGDGTVEWSHYIQNIFQREEVEGYLNLVANDGRVLHLPYSVRRFDRDDAETLVLGVVRMEMSQSNARGDENIDHPGEVSREDLHHLKNQLSAVLGFNEILTTENPDAEDAATCQAELAAAAQRALQILDGTENARAVALGGNQQPVETTSKGPGEVVANNQEVLFVDDEKALLRMYSKFIERQGFTVTAFSDAEAALNYFGRNHENVGMVLMDWMMPVLNGPRFLKAIHKIAPAKPVVVLSGKPVTTAGVFKTLEKPVDPTTLQTTIREAVSKNN